MQFVFAGKQISFFYTLCCPFVNIVNKPSSVKGDGSHWREKGGEIACGT